MSEADARSRRRRPPTNVDMRWAVTSMAVQALERSALARSGALAAAVGSGIRAEAVARRLHGHVDRGARPRQSLPHVHEDGRPGAPAVVLVNGWTASGLVWPAALVQALARSFHVVRVDNRGTGWSRRLGRPFTIGDLADDVRRVIEDRALGRPVVVGISMGGMITQELALRSPDHLAHAVLLGTRPPAPEHTSPPAAVTTRLMSPPQPGQPLGEFMRQRWEAVTGPGFHARHPEAMAEMIRTIVQRPTPRGAVLDQARAIAAWSGAGRLRRLQVPATVVHGSDDPLIPVRNGMRLSQLIPAARYVELPGVGHLVPHEAPDVIAELVGDVATRGS